MKHGYKTKADKKACEIREGLGLQYMDPLPGRRLARHFNVPVVTPLDIPDMNDDMIRSLTQDKRGFSALTFVGPGNHPIIIYNHLHARARQESDIMHEIAHIIEEHPPCAIKSVAGCPIRAYDEEHEDQAEYLGGALQIPRLALLWAVHRGMSSEEIGAYYTASPEMVRYRRNITGVDLQLQRSRYNGSSSGTQR